MTPIAVTIAGSDSGGGAGIQSDLKTFSALGVYGASVITALTAQNTQRVSGIHPVPADFVVAQLEAVFSDLAVNAVKIGMIADPDVVEGIKPYLSGNLTSKIVLDPVMVATSGDVLVSDKAARKIVEQLFPLADVITPNLLEAAYLTGEDRAKTLDEMKRQANSLLELGGRAVLLKGGHGDADTVIDLLYDGETFQTFRHPRIPTKNTHGSGCTLSSAIAAEFAKGADLLNAVAKGRQYIIAAIKNADRLQVGNGHGPTHHFHCWW